jgi:hypothetical protein
LPEVNRARIENFRVINTPPDYPECSKSFGQSEFDPPEKCRAEILIGADHSLIYVFLALGHQIL